MRPSVKALYIFGVIMVISMAILLLWEEWVMISILLPGVFLVLFFLDGLRTWPGAGFSIRHRMPKSLFIGETDHLEVEISLPDHWPSRRMEIAVDLGDKLKPVPNYIIAVDPLLCNLARVDLTPLFRGQAYVGTIWLRWQGALGLAGWVRKISVDHKLPVIPNIRAVAKDALRFSERDALFGIKPQWQLGDGSEFDALREYVPGFDSRAIDWKSSARHRKLICKEFQTERNHQIILAYDTGHLMMEPVRGIPKLDHVINAGLLLSYMSLKNGDRVGLVGFDVKVRQYLGPVAGVQNFAKIQQISAGLDYNPEEANYTLAMAEILSRLNRRSLIIVMTDFVDTVTADLMIDNMKRLSRRHLVVFVALKDRDVYDYAHKKVEHLDDLTATVVAQDFIQERNIVLERLRRLGIQYIDTTVENLKAELLNKYIHIKLREMI